MQIKWEDVLNTFFLNDAELINYVQKYETCIKANSDWEFVGIYYDEGISGTKKEKRTELLRLISDCENRNVDFIITKSISRFARTQQTVLSLFEI